ncbi:hypothetical protein YC2023_050507 [Brassica napus]
MDYISYLHQQTIKTHLAWWPHNLLPFPDILGSRESSVLNWPPVSVPLPSKPQIDGKGTLTGGQFKADDSPAGYMLLPCSVQLGKLEKLSSLQSPPLCLHRSTHS